MKVRAGASPNQFVIDAAPQEAGPALERAIASVGKVSTSNLSAGIIEGVGKYGLNTVKLTATLTEQDGSTVVTVVARSGSLGSSPVRSVVDRIKDAVVNDGNGSFAADRTGTSTSVVVVSVVAVAIGVVMILALLGL